MNATCVIQLLPQQVATLVTPPPSFALDELQNIDKFEEYIRAAAACYEVQFITLEGKTFAFALASIPDGANDRNTFTGEREMPLGKMLAGTAIEPYLVDSSRQRVATLRGSYEVFEYLVLKYWRDKANKFRSIRTDGVILYSCMENPPERTLEEIINLNFTDIIAKYYQYLKPGVRVIGARCRGFGERPKPHLLYIGTQPPPEEYKCCQYLTDHYILYSAGEWIGADMMSSSLIYVQLIQDNAVPILQPEITYKRVINDSVVLQEGTYHPIRFSSGYVYNAPPPADGYSVELLGDVTIKSQTRFKAALEAHYPIKIVSHCAKRPTLTLIGAVCAPCIGPDTHGPMSYDRWSPGGEFLNMNIVLDNVDVRIESAVPNFSLGAYGLETEDNNVSITLLNGATIECPEAHGKVVCTYIGDTYSGSTKRTGEATYELVTDTADTSPDGKTSLFED